MTPSGSNTERETRVPCALCAVEREQTGLDDIWCSSPECWVLPSEAGLSVVPVPEEDGDE